MLRLAACLEEHYPAFFVANAVVAEAKARGLRHEECHSRVEYVVAQGISSIVHDERVAIGSAHFVFEDEGRRIPEGDENKFAALTGACSHPYLAVSGASCRCDLYIGSAAGRGRKTPFGRSHVGGVWKIVMMTGDNEKTAAVVADKEVGV